MDRQIVKILPPSSSFVREAYQDSYKRFIQPAIERELRNELTERQMSKQSLFSAKTSVIFVATATKGKVVLGFDPAYRTGCKLAVVDATGKVLAIEVIYPHKPAAQAKEKLLDQLLSN